MPEPKKFTLQNTDWLSNDRMNLRSRISTSLLAALLTAASVYDAAARIHQTVADVTVEIVSGNNVASPPGRVHTIVFKVSNLGRSEATFQASLILPDAWHLASDLVPVSVPGEGSTICFVTFRIPETAEAGNYPITFLVAHTENADIRASIDARTTVEEMYDMELSITRRAEYAPAGRELVFSVFLFNRGNTESTFKLDANASHDAAVRLERSKVLLMPQESATIQARISTNGSLDHKIVQQAVVRAAIKENPTSFESATTHVNVIPLYSRLKPKAVPIPVYVSLQTVGDEQGTGAQLSVSGSTEALGGNISIDMNLANNNRLPMFGTRESYRIRYDRRNLRVNLGDHIQEISPLTTTGQYGVGISAQGKAGKFDFMGTALKTRYVFPTQSLLGGSLGYQVNDAVKVSTNVLHRVGLYDGTATTARGSFSPFGNRHTLNLECGVDTGGGLSKPSCMVVVLGSSTRIGYQGRVLRTSGSFPGSNKNLSEYFGNVSYQFSWGLRLDGTYRDQQRNYFDGYGRSSDYFRVGGGFSQRIGPASTFLDVHYLRQQLSHQSSELIADRIEEALRIRSGFQMRAVGLRGSVDIGQAESSAFSYQGSVIRSRVSARISPTSKLTFSASGDYASGYLINTARQMSRWLVSGQISIRLDNSTQLVTTVYRNTTTTLDKQLYTSYQAHLRHTFLSGHRLQIRGQHSLMEGFRSSGTTDYKISYSLPLGIPMRRGKVSDDYISGRIYDAEADAGMEGVLIFLGDGVTISEKDGTFRIPRSHSGTDFLRIDQKSIGIDRVPIIQMPLQIDTDDPYLDIIEIPVVRAASLVGSLSLYGSATGELMIGEDPLRMQKISVIRDVILELSSGEDRFRTRTDRWGRYRFIGIRPGTYKLKIITAPLSDKYTIHPTVVNISPKSGEKIIKDFTARPIVRKIIRLNSSDLSVLSTDETDTSVGAVVEGLSGEREKSKKDGNVPLSEQVVVALDPPPVAGSSDDNSATTFTGDTDGYTLMVGSHLTQAQAQGSINSFSSLGLPLGVLEYQNAEVTRYRVGVGIFPTIDSAVEALESMSGQLPTETWVYRIPLSEQAEVALDPPPAADPSDDYSATIFARDTDGYTLMVGSHLTQAEAQGSINSFSSLGLPLGVLEYQNAEVTRYRVGVGIFPTIDSAVEALESMNGQLPTETWVYRIR